MDEFENLLPALAGLVVFVLVIAAIAAGVGWLLLHPITIAVVVGGFGLLIWYGARRNRV